MTANTRQFDRRCILYVGNDGSGIEIKDLRMVFEVVKTNDLKPNTARIAVYNPSVETRKKLLQVYDEFVIKAGYAKVQQLYAGKVRRAYETKQGQDIVVVIESGDGDDIFQKTIKKTLPAGSTVEQVLVNVQDVTGMRSNIYNAALKKSGSGRGVVLYGKVSDVLYGLEKQTNSAISVQDGQLTVLHDTQPITGMVWDINAETGMVGSPEVNDSGMTVRTLLNPEYKIGGVAKVSSSVRLSYGLRPSVLSDYQKNYVSAVEDWANADNKNNQDAASNVKDAKEKYAIAQRKSVVYSAMRIEKLIHKGDTHEGEWISELTGLNA